MVVVNNLVSRSSSLFAVLPSSSHQQGKMRSISTRASWEVVWEVSNHYWDDLTHSWVGGRHYWEGRRWGVAWLILRRSEMACENRIIIHLQRTKIDTQTNININSLTHYRDAH